VSDGLVRERFRLDSGASASPDLAAFAGGISPSTEADRPAAEGVVFFTGAESGFSTGLSLAARLPESFTAGVVFESRDAASRSWLAAVAGAGPAAVRGLVADGVVPSVPAVSGCSGKTGSLDGVSMEEAAFASRVKV
jgi:hypothetical protein